MSNFLLSMFVFETLLLFLLVVYVRSVHRQKNEKEALEKGVTGLLDDIMNASEAGKLIFDNDGALYIVNRAARDFLCAIDRLSVEGLTRQAFLDALYDYAADFDESIKNTILSEYSKEDTPEFIEVIQCDRACFFLVEGRSVSDGMTVFTMMDISAGQKREENILMLHEFNNQLMQAIQATTSGIVISDPKAPGNPILFANDAFCEFVGCSREELLNMGWPILSPMFEDEREKELFFEVLSDAQDADFSLVSTDEKSRSSYNMRLTPVYDDEEEDEDDLDLFVGVLTDVSLLKQRESEFFHAQKLESLGQLAAGVAHDFNNILSIIGGYSVMAKGLIGAEHEESEKIVSYLDKIETASQRGAGLTRKMLTFSKHKVVAQSVVNVCDIIQEQKELLVPLLGVNISLNLDVPIDALNVHGNMDSIGQIIMNLSINARDAMESGGDLAISVKGLQNDEVPQAVSAKMMSEEYVVISVSDTGTGMDEETLEKVFDPFFSTKEQGKGTGLGLSVVYGLVQEMGGMILVQSVVGQGTTMSVYIPRTYDGQTKTIIGDEADLSKVCLDGYTALVAEDEPDLLLLVTSMLEEIGLNVIAASNGNEALMLLEEHEGEIDILLTDVIMPEMNGVKLAELVSALDPSVNIFFMSGYPASGDRAPVELPEGAAFIAKPVNYEALVALLFSKLKEGVSSSVGADMPYWKTEGKVEAHG